MLDHSSSSSLNNSDNGSGRNSIKAIDVFPLDFKQGSWQSRGMLRGSGWAKWNFDDMCTEWRNVTLIIVLNPL